MKDKKYWFFMLAGLEFAYWVALAPYSYLAVYLDSIGYSVTRVSVITTIISFVALISTPIMGVVADKLKSSGRTLNICMIGLAITYALVPLTAGIKIYSISIMVLFIIVSRFFYGPCTSLMESTVVTGCANTENDYGRARLFGSSSWVIMSVILGAIIVPANSGLTFYLLAIFLIPCIYFANKLRTISDDKKVEGEKVSLKDLPYGKLLKNPYFLAYIVFIIIVHIPQNMNSTYLPYLLKETGSNTGAIGYIQALRAAFEIPTLFMSAKIQEKISLKNMVIISSILIAIQSAMFSTVTSFGGIVLYSSLAGIAQGFSIAGMYKFVFTLAPKELRQTAQTINGATTSLAGIICNAVGALWVASIGVKSFYLANGLFLAVVIVLYIFSFSFIEKVLKVPFVDYSKTND